MFTVPCHQLLLGNNPVGRGKSGDCGETACRVMDTSLCSLAIAPWFGDPALTNSALNWTKSAGPTPWEEGSIISGRSLIYSIMSNV